MKPSRNNTAEENSKKIPEDIKEEKDSIMAYDAAKAEEDEIIPFDQAVKEIEAKHSGLGKSPTFGISLTRE